ncbi:hypothetical protein D6827_00375 [Candidatus Parcubacteria bacterium]|nr:MAG: hypothetical protein D6827_00375 [Candidatus Parcubacteria bacterium]
MSNEKSISDKRLRCLCGNLIKIDKEHAFIYCSSSSCFFHYVGYPASPDDDDETKRNAIKSIADDFRCNGCKSQNCRVDSAKGNEVIALFLICNNCNWVTFWDVVTC